MNITIEQVAARIGDIQRMQDILDRIRAGDVKKEDAKRISNIVDTILDVAIFEVEKAISQNSVRPEAG